MSYRFVKYNPRYREQVIRLQTHLWDSNLAVNRRYLAWRYEQIRRLSQEGLIEIGGHTVNHARLPCQKTNDQRNEIVANKTTLQALTGALVTSFAYPYGAYNQDTVRLVKEAGYARACTVNLGRISGKTDPFLLRRYEVGNWDAETLYRRLFKYVRH